MAVSKAQIELELKNKDVEKDLKNVESMLSSFGAKVDTALTVVSLGVIAKGLYDVGASAVSAFNEAQAAEKKLGAVLKATGESAGKTKEELISYADTLEALTNVQGETIQQGQAVLLTFKEIKGDNFDRATKSALDMAAVIGGDAAGAAMQLGKALNDPVNGISALSRSGVSFSETQKEAIKILAESGRLAEAQAIILDELDAEFGGAADATDNFGDKQATLATKFGKVEEALGEAIANGLEPMLPLVDDLIQQGAELMPFIAGAVISLSELATALFGSSDGISANISGMENMTAELDLWATGISTVFSDWNGFVHSVLAGTSDMNAAIADWLGFDGAAATYREEQAYHLAELTKITDETHTARIEARKREEQEAKANRERIKAEMAQEAEDRRKQALILEGIVTEQQIAEMGVKKAEELARNEKIKKAKEAAEAEKAALAKEKAEKKAIEDKSKAEEKAAKEAAEKEAESLREAERIAQEEADKAKEEQAKKTNDLLSSIGREGISDQHKRIQDSLIKQAVAARRQEEIDKEKVEAEKQTADALAKSSANVTNKALHPSKPKFAPEDDDPLAAFYGGPSTGTATFADVNTHSDRRKLAKAKKDAEEQVAIEGMFKGTTSSSSDKTKVVVNTEQDKVVAAIDNQTKTLATAMASTTGTKMK